MRDKGPRQVYLEAVGVLRELYLSKRKKFDVICRVKKRQRVWLRTWS